VLVQTIAPEARAIVHAARHDSDGFLAGELERRRALDYPPFSHLIRIVCSAVESQHARAAAAAVRERLAGSAADGGAAVGDGPVVLGPAALFRLRGRERQVLVVKAGERRSAVAAVGEAVEQVSSIRAHASVNFSVDVDPQ
jgi:primosomal protein N' (replication factor Y)